MQNQNLKYKVTSIRISSYLPWIGVKMSVPVPVKLNLFKFCTENPGTYT